MTVLKLEQANTIIAAAIARGRAMNLDPLAVAVLDAGGHLLAFQREDGAGFARFHLAHAKAWGALGMGFGTRELMERAESFPAFVMAASAATGGRMIPSPGGVLILDANAAVIGAVGASGDAGDNDEICVLAAIDAVGLAARPGAGEG
ncbi:heme-binding protein [Micromonospora krabiensis]|uniref:GlcG/HbpS family heme-binding protein n=1 Tax=Micromonospora krabiensis TaxID=307121 RepID=UPI000B898475|nr:heme-binding protein [Micromonospora krabiensis]